MKQNCQDDKSYMKDVAFSILEDMEPMVDPMTGKMYWVNKKDMKTLMNNIKNKLERND